MTAVASIRDLPHATFRQTLDDFVVEELPAYLPSGEGEHLFLTVRKRGTTTLDAARGICRALGVDDRGMGYAGMKDRRGVTTQMISVPFARDQDAARALDLSIPGVEILAATRHPNKLKPGHLVGNRFTIVLRDLTQEACSSLRSLLGTASSEGIPNAFGPQRFGRDGDNPERALAWLTGRERGPRDRREQRLLFSALQSHLFNQVLAQRVASGTFRTPLAGDLLKKRDTGGLFDCTEPAVDAVRAARGEVSPTGPLFGKKMRWPAGEPADIERHVLAALGCSADVFDQHPKFGEGSRRPLRIFVSEPDAEPQNDPSVLRIRFVLPKGGYATTVLAEAVALKENAPHDNATLHEETSRDELGSG